MRALQIHAGPRARAWLREHGLRAVDVRAVPAAAGGPKGLVLNPLDRHLFARWLPQAGGVVHLLGASIGAWRMASACRPDADAALGRMAEAYVTQRYEHAPGRAPAPSHVSAVFGRTLGEHLADADELLRHPRYRLHVFTSHGRGLLARQGRVRTTAGYAAAFAVNAVHRRLLGTMIERVVFSDPRNPLPVGLADLRGRTAELGPHNLAAAVQASCSIPFWLDAVHDIPGAPPGAYWDGGITDYHLHLDYAAMGQGIVLYPHFQPRVVPGWLDKPWRWRHRSTRALDDVVLLSPHPDWVRGLPGGKLPDRSDFRRYADDPAGRERVWRRAIAESERLAEEFARAADRATLDVAPLP